MTTLTLAPQAERVGPAPPVTVPLSSAEAQRRLTQFGPNEIRREQATNALTLLLRQSASPVIWLLLVATVLSAALGEWLDAIAIGAIVILNAVAATFTICVLGGVIAPDLPIPHRTLELLLPAFRWISWSLFELGLVETFVFGVYGGWLLASLHNLFARQWGTTRHTFDSRAA